MAKLIGFIILPHSENDMKIVRKAYDNGSNGRMESIFPSIEFVRLFKKGKAHQRVRRWAGRPVGRLAKRPAGFPAGRSARRPAGRPGGARVVSGAEKKII